MLERGNIFVKSVIIGEDPAETCLNTIRALLAHIFGILERGWIS